MVQVLLQVTVLEHRARLAPPCPDPTPEAPPWGGTHTQCGTSAQFQAAHSCPGASGNLTVEQGLGQPHLVPYPLPPRPQGEELTRYSNTSVSERSVWMRSCRVTILACFRFFSRDTVGTQACLGPWCLHARHTLSSAQRVPPSAMPLHPQAPARHRSGKPAPPSSPRGAGPWDAVPSRMAVQGAPSSCSSRISLRATRFSVSLLRPLKTVA